MNQRQTLFLLIGLMLLVGVVAADTLTVPDTDPNVNQQKSINVLLSATGGLAGYNVTFTLDNATIAQIYSVSFPSWAPIHTASTTPGTTITTTGIDLANSITAPASNVAIVTLTIKGLSEGTANLTAVVNQIDDDSGNPVTPTVINGTITVSGTNRPKATATIAPLPTDLSNQITEGLGGDEQPALGEEGINWTGLISAGYGAYEDPLGPLAAILIFALPFLMMWITQKDMTLPGMVGALLGLFIIIRLPATWHVASVTMIAISVVAVIYSLVKERV